MVAHILRCIRRFEAITDWKDEAKRETRLAAWLDINNNNNKENESGISEFDGSIVPVD